MPPRGAECILVVHDALKYHLLKALADNPALSQRQLAAQLGISLGKANYCLQAFIDKGLVKVEREGGNSCKTRCQYVLTTPGLEAKARVAHRFLQHKMQSYEALRQEIAALQAEVAAMKDGGAD